MILRLERITHSKNQILELTRKKNQIFLLANQTSDLHSPLLGAVNCAYPTPPSASVKFGNFLVAARIFFF